MTSVCQIFAIPACIYNIVYNIVYNIAMAADALRLEYSQPAPNFHSVDKDMTAMDSLAEKLWQTRLSGKTLENLTAPTSIEEAYALQDLATACSKQSVNGIKIGATSKEIQELLQVSEPFYGPLFNDYTRPSGSVVTVDKVQNPRVEPEFVVCLGKDLKATTNQATTLATVEDAVDWIAPGF